MRYHGVVVHFHSYRIAKQLCPDYIMHTFACFQHCCSVWRSKTLCGGPSWRRRVSETTCSSNRAEFQAPTYEGEIIEYRKEKHDSLSVDERIRRKRADLFQRSRKKEPLEAELVVLFGSVAVILIIPWVVHDYRFIFILPAIVFAVPGLRGVVFQAAVEIYDYFATQRSARMTQRVRNKGGTAESDGSRRRYATMRRAREVVDNQRADDSTTVRKTQKTRRTYHPSRQQSSTKQHRVSNKSARLSRNRDDDALIRVVKRLPLLRDWGGFL